MNLNQITARIGELSAELLTLHKDLAFLVEGSVTRAEPAFEGFDWKTLKTGDKVYVQTSIRVHGGDTLAPGIYEVDMVEDHSYDGGLSFSIFTDKPADESSWVFYINPQEEEATDYSRRGNSGSNAYGLIRKVS